MTVNKVILIGNLGRDPEIRTANNGARVGTLSLATTHRVKDGDGNWNNATEWHRVTVFGKTADNVERYCTKGKQLYIEGRLQTRKWQDKDGNDRWSTEVVAQDVRFLGGRESSGDDYAKPPRGDAAAHRGSARRVPDADIPF